MMTWLCGPRLTWVSNTIPGKSAAAAGARYVCALPSCSTSCSTRSMCVALAPGNATQKLCPSTRSAGKPVMRAAVADHAAIVQSGAIATTPCSRLSNSSFASMRGPSLKNTTPRWPYRGRNGADGAAQEHLRWGRNGLSVKRRVV